MIGPKFEKRIYSAREIGAPIEKESVEKNEVFKATLGFDFIFTESDGIRKIYCLEINGDNTGISGVQEISNDKINSTHKIMADIRSTKDPNFLRKNSLREEIKNDSPSGDFNATRENTGKIAEYIIDSILREKLFKFAYRNPQVITKMTEDKKLQLEVIPEENKIREYKEGMHLISSTGYWIAKPRNGVRGENIYIIKNSDIHHTVDNMKSDNILDYFIIQELVISSGADNAPEDQRMNSASLRLLIDFRYLEDGSIDIQYESAYQRVSKIPQKYKSFDREGDLSIVVNKATGATSVEVSKLEFESAHEVALQCIQKIAERYKQTLKK